MISNAFFCSSWFAMASSCSAMWESTIATCQFSAKGHAVKGSHTLITNKQTLTILYQCIQNLMDAIEQIKVLIH